jgi:hypothetical protein
MVCADYAEDEGSDQGAVMRARVAARLGWTIFGLAVLAYVVALTLNLRRPQSAELSETTGDLVFALTFLPYGWLGARIVPRQPHLLMCWLLCALGLQGGLIGFASEYAIYGLVTRPGAVPGAAAMAWLTFWAAPVVLLLLAALLALFPTGRPVSPRWRWVLWLAGVGNLLFVLSSLSLWPLRGVALLGIRSPEPTGGLMVLYSLGAMAAMVAVLAAAVSLVVRFRRASGVERQQLKWLAYAGMLAVLGFPLLIAAEGATHPPELVADIAASVLILPIPVAVSVAVLRYRLYDVDRLINRTLVYGLLTALLGVVYAGVVLGLGELFGGISAKPSSWAVAGATLTVAALFQPARRRIQAIVDRRFNRRKYDTAKTVEAFGARLRDEVDLDALTAELLVVVDQTMQPTRASLWLRPSAPHSRRTTP